MAETRQLVVEMEQAEQRGDRLSARRLAQAILDASGAAGADARDAATTSADPGTGVPGDEAQRLANELLARTEPDPFLLLVGIAGLGLLVWLVYNYVL